MPAITEQTAKVTEFEEIHGNQLVTKGLYDPTVFTHTCILQYQD